MSDGSDNRCPASGASSCEACAMPGCSEPVESAVPLEEQLAALRAGGEKALLKLRDDLARRSYREHILALAQERLVAVGYPQYGDATCHLSRDEAQREADCEVADYPVYITLAGLARRQKLW